MRQSQFESMLADHEKRLKELEKIGKPKFNVLSSQEGSVHTNKEVNTKTAANVSSPSGDTNAPQESKLAEDLHDRRDKPVEKKKEVLN